MSTIVQISPYSRYRTKIGSSTEVSKNISNCRFRETSSNVFVFEGKQGYETYSFFGTYSFFQPNQPFSARFIKSDYETGTNHRRWLYEAGGTTSFPLDSIIAATKLFPTLQVGEFEQIDISLSGINLPTPRTSSNYSFEYCTSLSDFTIDEFPDNPDSSTILSGTTGNITSSRTMTLEESQIGTGEFFVINNGNIAHVDSFCKARFGLYLPNTMPTNAVWVYNEYYQTWSGPTHATPGVPDDNAFHLYIDWYFG